MKKNKNMSCASINRILLATLHLSNTMTFLLLQLFIDLHSIFLFILPATAVLVLAHRKFLNARNVC